MAWVMDTYAMHLGQATTAVVTGKPIELGGSRGRKEATGRGVMICCDKALAKLGIKKQGCRVVVQGFGNVGSMAADLMQKAGYKIIGLADIGGGLYNEKGFDVPKVIDWVYTQKKPLQDFPGGGTKMSARDVLFQPCDIAIPAAIENQITEKNANQVKAKILCEGANGPTTWQADAIIDAKGIFTVPDILGNAGGVTVSYFEWVQDRQGFFWRESEVNERLFDVMDNAFDEVVRFAELHKVNNRIAAYMLAIEGIVHDVEEALVYFALAPEETLTILDPLEITDRDSASIAENIRHRKDAFGVDNRVGLPGGGAVGAFAENFGLDLIGIFFGDLIF